MFAGRFDKGSEDGIFWYAEIVEVTGFFMLGNAYTVKGFVKGRY